MTKILKSRLTGNYLPCLIRDCGDYVILDTACWRSIRQRGLGDTIHAALAALGITRIVGPCSGCDKRIVWLNNLAPYRR